MDRGGKGGRAGGVACVGFAIYEDGRGHETHWTAGMLGDLNLEGKTLRSGLDGLRFKVRVLVVQAWGDVGVRPQ